jgi:endonuclease III
MKRVSARSQRRKAPRVPRPFVTKTSAPQKSRSVAPNRKTAAPKPAPIVVTPELRRRALRLLDGLREAYPDAHCELDFTTALEALIATILAAQCTDARVNQVTPLLFKKYRTARDYLNADEEVFKEEITSTGFFNNKTKAIKAAAKLLVEKFNGEMPRTMEELVQLPGVGRKTANVILANIYGVPGVVVEPHGLLRPTRCRQGRAGHDCDLSRERMDITLPSHSVARPPLLHGA